MRFSLYQKLAWSLLGLFVLIVGAFVVVVQSLEALARDQAEQELHLELAAHLVQDNPLLSSGKHDQQALQNLFHSMMILGPNFEFYILDEFGKVMTYSAKPGEVKRHQVDLRPIETMLKGEQSFPLYADDPRSEQQKIFSVAPILKDDHLTGYLFVIIGGKLYDGIFSAIKDNEQVQLLGVLVITSLIFLLVILLLTFGFFVRPLKRFTRNVAALKVDGGESHLALLETDDSGIEVSELSQAFNQLIVRINVQFKQLASVDKERRELLAHLSHDLRTPLASLQGYLETIKLKQSQLSTQDFAGYIERCLKNTVSLKGFVDQIFELAHLESGEISVCKEKFPLADLLYDMVDKFSLVAREKDVILKVELESDTLQVNTDIAKLERILTNLIENAIRHTPTGGKIWLIASVDEQTNQVRLVVRDSGTGILQEEVAFLFEPRFRGKKAVDDGGRHIGLGLTITRKLVNILGGEIAAENNLEGGACFKVTIPIQV